MASPEDIIPSFDQLVRLAPTATIIMLIVGVGFYAGWKAREGHIVTLKEWLDDFRNSPKKTPPKDE